MRAPALSARTAGAPRAAAHVSAAAAPPLALLALLALLAGPPPAGALGRGETVHLSGQVADREGRPLAGLAVVLSASRTYFSLRRMESAEASPRSVSAETDAAGRYALDWPWDDHYNHFELAVGIALPGARGARPEVLERRDVSERMAALGGAADPRLAIPFTLENAAYVEKLRRFVAGIASADERRVYGEMGHPDEVKSVRFPDHEEVSWWYFESGKVYRFEGGRLAQVIPFDPVKPF